MGRVAQGSTPAARVSGAGSVPVCRPPVRVLRLEWDERRVRFARLRQLWGFYRVLGILGGWLRQHR